MTRPGPIINLTLFALSLGGAGPAWAKDDPEPSAPPVNDATDLEIEVVLDTPQARDGAEQVIESEDAITRAGTQGDVVAAVRTLPGVARSSPSSGELSLWGALPEQSRLYVASIPVPRLFHWGLARSVLPASQIRSMRIEPVAFEADYGRAIGGMANVKLKSALEHEDARIHSQIDLSLLEGAAALSQKPNARWGWSASLRHSLQAQVMRGVLPRARQRLFPLADNLDYQTSLARRVGHQGTLELRMFGAQSRQEIARNSGERSRSFSQRRKDQFHRVALSYRHEGTKHQRKLIFWLGLQSNQDQMQWAQGRLVAGRSRRSFPGGLRTSSTHWYKNRLKVRLGTDLEWSLGRYAQQGSQTLPAREGDPRVWGQRPGPEYSEDKWRISRVYIAPFATVTGYLGDRWSVALGLRFATSASSSDRQWPARPTEPSSGILNKDFGVSPRLAVRWTRSRWDHWSLRAGIHRQLAAPEDLSPRFGNPKLTAQRAYQIALAVNLFPLPKLKSDWTFFWNQQLDLATRSIQPSPALTENLLNQGLGRNFGGQTQLTYSPYPWISMIAHYSFTLSQKKDHPSLAFRPTDLAQNHQAQALVSGTWGKAWTLSGRFQWSSGFPRTPVLGASAMDEGATFAPIFGKTNRDALPDFWSGSLRLAYQKSWGPKADRMIRVWLDVQNITNHANVEEFSYAYNYSRRYTMPGLPIFPSLGVTLRR